MNTNVINAVGKLNITTPTHKKFEVKRSKAIQAEREARKLEKQERDLQKFGVALMLWARKAWREQEALQARLAADAAQRAEQERSEALRAAEAQQQADFEAWMQATGKRAGNPGRRERLFDAFLSEKVTA